MASFVKFYQKETKLPNINFWVYLKKFMILVSLPKALSNNDIKNHSLGNFKYFKPNEKFNSTIITVKKFPNNCKGSLFLENF